MRSILRFVPDFIMLVESYIK